MATAMAKTQCSVCNKETSTFLCQGCLRNFCRTDLNKHLQLLAEQFDQIESKHDELRQKILDQKDDPKERSLLKQIDEWENNSIEKIKQTAEECRRTLIQYTNKSLTELEIKLNGLAEQLRRSREENEYNEIDLKHFKEKLSNLIAELNQPSNISIKEESTSFINKVSVIPINTKKTKWKQNGITVAGGNGGGNGLNQLCRPECMYIDDDQTMYIVDCNNDRVVEWKLNSANGRIVAGGNGRCNQIHQLNNPKDVILDKENNCLIISDYGNRRVIQWSLQNGTKNVQVIISNIDCYGLATDKDGCLYVSDCEKNEVRRWRRGETKGTIVAGGNGKGYRLNQLSWPNYIFIDENYSLYISDMRNQRVMKWKRDAKEGVIVAGGYGQGNSLSQLSSPHGLSVDQFGQIFVSEWDNNRITCWCEGAEEGRIVVGGKGEGNQSSQLRCPAGLSFDREGNLYVADAINHRIQKCEIDCD